MTFCQIFQTCNAVNPIYERESAVLTNSDNLLTIQVILERLNWASVREIDLETNRVNDVVQHVRDLA